ncbi:MAG: nucleoside permease [Flavobacteriaceae bacterium]|uniref:Nucleoside permease n=1 Tax=Flavobacterium kayseriense TaxID=2764714 RepID=A0ABR7J8Z4_9FLAO|nr:nucleoside permease [Flavobacterium kayseriense]MBC5841990.1 nucleoside permease [Flavobacterium kayseriense]MBC5848519.1 nucleoside permease [Flavobacterium kayseriense]MBX9888777.1 nucleoside permease [Flavobacteriaceae bacterium]
MNIRLRLTIMNFFQFFVWGIWLISLGGYMGQTFGPIEGGSIGLSIGRTYGSMGWASLFMPALLGIIADKYFSAQKVLGLAHIAAGIAIYFATQATNSTEMYWVIFATSCFYMPTIALNNSVSYAVLNKYSFDVQKTFTPIRVWGTVGFIFAMWITDLTDWKSNTNQFVFASIAMIITGIFCFTLPNVPAENRNSNQTLTSKFGLDSFVLFKQKKMAIFFVFAMLLGAALQITNMFGDTFIRDFGSNPEYQGTFGVEHSVLIISLSQISETLFILTIPFFLRKFGIKQVMIFSMIAWVLRFALFGIGNPGSGVIFLILSMVVYGMAFDFFNISGSLFVEKETDSKIRSSAQGLFMLMTNGIGAIVGGELAGRTVSYYTVDNKVEWPSVWFSFAAYAFVIMIAFAILFKYKHDPKIADSLNH